jgi:hypothetical protein
LHVITDFLFYLRARDCYHLPRKRPASSIAFLFLEKPALGSVDVYLSFVCYCKPLQGEWKVSLRLILQIRMMGIHTQMLRLQLPQAAATLQQQQQQQQQLQQQRRQRRRRQPVRSVRRL